jgi:hypothetical protein
MSKPRAPKCPVCEEKTQWDEQQQRYECEGLSQHCFQVKGRGLSRSLMLIASDSGEDAELFTLYPWPREG